MEQKKDNMSFKSLLCHIRDNTNVQNDVWADVKGVVASAKMSADPLAYLKTKMAECNEHICADCLVIGLIWKLIDCDHSRINELYSKCDMFIRDHSEDEDLRIIAREGFVFYRWYMMSLLLEKEINNLKNVNPKGVLLGGVNIMKCNWEKYS